MANPPEPPTDAIENWERAIDGPDNYESHSIVEAGNALAEYCQAIIKARGEEQETHRDSMLRASKNITMWRDAYTAAEGDVQLFLEALIWCSGSADFGPGGKAQEGFDKLCRPLIDKYAAKQEEDERAKSET